MRVLGVCLTALIFLLLVRVAQAAAQSMPRTPNTGHHRVTPKSNGTPRPTAPCIVVRAPQTEQGRRHDLAGQLTIGRGAECDVTIDDGYSSQVHARLYQRNGQHMVEDLGSTNGTYVNRQRVQSTTVVQSGDHIQVGATVFELDA